MDDMDGGTSIRRRGNDLTMALRIEGIVRTMTEIEQGRRPVGALDPVSSPMVARRIRLMIEDQRADRRSRTPRGAVVRVLASSTSRPSVGAAEGAVVVRCGVRARAYSVRLEQEGDRWRIVELASPDTPLSAVTTRASTEGRLPEDEHGIRHSSGPDGAGFFVDTPGGPTLRITPDDPAYQDREALAGEQSKGEGEDTVESKGEGTVEGTVEGEAGRDESEDAEDAGDGGEDGRDGGVTRR